MIVRLRSQLLGCHTHARKHSASSETPRLPLTSTTIRLLRSVARGEAALLGPSVAGAWQAAAGLHPARAYTRAPRTRPAG